MRLLVVGAFLTTAACGGDEPLAPAAPPPGGVPQGACAVGGIEADGGCRAPGVSPDACGEGFEHDGDRGCRALLPAEPCASGMFAIPGDSTCRPVGVCAGGEYPDVVGSTSIQHVRAGYTGAESNGSIDAPWRTIQEGVDHAERGATVAIAAGVYEEDVFVLDTVVLAGVCPALVEIRGVDEAILIGPGADGTRVTGVAVTGSGVGIGLTGVEDVVLDGVWVHDTGLHGIHANDGFGEVGATMTGVLVERARQFGVGITTTALVVDRSVVRDTLELSGAAAGAGIATFGKDDRELVVTRSVVEGNHDAGVFIAGARARIEATLVRNTQPDSADGLTGQGLFVAPNLQFENRRPSLAVAASVIEDNHSVGIHVYGGDLTVSDTVVRDTRPREGTSDSGRGMSIEFELGRSVAEITGSLLDANTDAGILLHGSDLTLRGTLVRGTLPQPADLAGSGGLVVQAAPESGDRSVASVFDCVLESNHPSGILVGGSDLLADNLAILDTQAQAADADLGRGLEARFDPDLLEPANVTLADSLIQGSHDAGVLVAGATVVLERTTIRDTLARGTDGRYGDGLTVFAPGVALESKARLVGSRIEGSARAGIASFGSVVEIGDSVLSCNPIDLDGEQIGAAPFDFVELAPNSCGCAAVAACLVQTANLEPPEL